MAKVTGDRNAPKSVKTINDLSQDELQNIVRFLCLRDRLKVETLNDNWYRACVHWWLMQTEIPCREVYKKIGDKFILRPEFMEIIKRCPNLKVFDGFMVMICATIDRRLLMQQLASSCRYIEKFTVNDLSDFITYLKIVGSDNRLKFLRIFELREPTDDDFQLMSDNLLRIEVLKVYGLSSSLSSVARVSLQKLGSRIIEFDGDHNILNSLVPCVRMETLGEISYFQDDFFTGLNQNFPQLKVIKKITLTIESHLPYLIEYPYRHLKIHDVHAYFSYLYPDLKFGFRKLLASRGILKLRMDSVVINNNIPDMTGVWLTVADSCPDLKEFEVTGGVKISDEREVFQSLIQMKKLTSISIHASHKGFTYDQVKVLLDSLVHLKKILYYPNFNQRISDSFKKDVKKYLELHPERTLEY